MPTRDLPWGDAIKRVLSEQGEPMRLSEIAQAIIDKGYRANVGATPASAVAAVVSRIPLSQEVEKVERGLYRYPPVDTEELVEPRDRTDLTEVTPKPPTRGDAVTGVQPAEEPGLLNAFGLFWRRSEIDWSSTSVKLLGTQLAGSAAVDFGDQVGVYVLYDASRLVYVGRVSEPRLGRRLRDHTRDRLSGRWDRFSWFGVRPVGDDGRLGDLPVGSITVDLVISTLEALLIESLEPPQNRRQGDGFAELEFIQQIDPSIERKRKKQLLSELGEKL